MCFNEISLILFKIFLQGGTKPSDRKEAIELILYDHTNKLYQSGNHPKDSSSLIYKCSFSQMIQNQFTMITNQYCKLKKKAFTIEYNNDREYIQLAQRCKAIINDSQSLLGKKPFIDFVQMKPSDAILSNHSLCQTFLHVQLHYIYYLLFLSTDDPILLSFHQLKPLAFKTFTKEPIESSQHCHRPISLINSTINFFSRNYKRYPLILQSLNESSIEILIHIIVLNYHFTKKIKSAFILKHKPIQTIQTMIMLQNQNKHNIDYVHVISMLLSSFFNQSTKNIAILMKVIDVSNIPYDECKLLVKKIFTSHYKPNIAKTFSIIIEMILHLRNSNDTLKEFLIEVLIMLFNYYSEDESNYSLFFSFFYEETLKRFSVKLNRDLMRLEYIDYNKTSVKNNKISLRQKEFIELMIEKYGIVIKKIFPVILGWYEKAFGSVFDILNALTFDTEIYYNNIPNHHKESRKVLLNYFTLNFDLVPTEVLCHKIIRYYLKPDITTYRNGIALSFDSNDEEMGITIAKMSNGVQRIEYIASEEYKTKIMNSMTNLFKCYPFNDVNTLSTLLEILLDKDTDQGDSEKEEIVSLSHLLLNKEDEDEISKSIEIINANCSEYRNKLLETIFIQLNVLSIDDISKLKNPITLLVFSLKKFIAMNNENLIETCLTTLLSAVKSNPKIIPLSKSFQLLSIISEIDSSKGSNNFESYSDDLYSLITEVKKALVSIGNDYDKEEDKYQTNGDSKELDGLMNAVREIKFSMDNSYSIKKLIAFLSKPKNNTHQIDIITTKKLFDIANKHLTQSNSSFYLELSIKLFASVYLYTKTSKDNRTYFLKLMKEELMSALSSKQFNQSISDRLFEVLVKVIKKIKKATCFIANDLLQIVFELFDTHLSMMTHISIASCLALMSYIVEYAQMEINREYNTIIRTGINYLSSQSSTNEIKRASALLLLKILKHLSSEELSPYSSLIFQAINNQVTRFQKDNVLYYYLRQCLNYYS